MATEQPVWIRQYLKNLGATDDDIGYNNNTVLLKGKPIYYGTPTAEGKVMGSQADFDAAYSSYQGQEALDAYKQAVTKPYQPKTFTYDVNQIKASPEYQAGLASLQKDAESATNRSLVNLGRRGIGNSQSAVVADTSQQQNVVNQANNVLLPRAIAEKYQQFTTEQAAAERAADQQRQGLRDLASVYTGQAAAITNAEQQRQAAIQNNDLAQQEATAKADQQQLDNLWKAADQLGVIPDSLADYYGLKRGIRTLEATKTLEQLGIQRGQLGVSQKNAETSRMSADTAAGSAGFKQLMDTWKATGIAPSGIQGVPEGMPWQGDGATPGFKLGDFQRQVLQNFYTENEYGQKSFDAAKARKYILGLELPDTMTDELLRINGLQTN